MNRCLVFLAALYTFTMGLGSISAQAASSSNQLSTLSGFHVPDFRLELVTGVRHQYGETVLRECHTCFPMEVGGTQVRVGLSFNFLSAVGVQAAARVGVQLDRVNSPTNRLPFNGPKTGGGFDLGLILAPESAPFNARLALVVDWAHKGLNTSAHWVGGELAFAFDPSFFLPKRQNGIHVGMFYQFGNRAFASPYGPVHFFTQAGGLMVEGHFTLATHRARRGKSKRTK